jgi:hypothetical protein
VLSVTRRGRNAVAPVENRCQARKAVMKANIGTVDRVVRVIAGLVIIGVGVAYRSWWGLIGLLPLLTAAIRYCPAYVPFGIRTCPRDAEKTPAPPAGPKTP